MECIQRATAWMERDPNERTSQYVKDLLVRHSDGSEDAGKELLSLFPDDGSRIEFGTAGLRSKMMPGPLGMNEVVVVQTAQGLARCCQKEHSGESNIRIVVGYDHREQAALGLSSLSFAIISAIVFKQAGIECVLLDGYVHTPLVSFSTVRLGAAAGIMVTASHNPKDDAGYKVYWQDGCQIRPPIDKEISAAIGLNMEPWADYKDILVGLHETAEGDPCLGLSDREVTERMKEAYFDAIKQSGLVIPVSVATAPSFVYSAMHGIGFPFARRVFDLFGIPQFNSVSLQELPDPMFSSVPFPNPEEKGALDAAKQYALEIGSTVVFANDPDADRLAVAEFCKASESWTTFTGDQIGVLLGCWLWEKIGKRSDKVCPLSLSCCGVYCTFLTPCLVSTASCNVCLSSVLSHAKQSSRSRRVSI